MTNLVAGQNLSWPEGSARIRLDGAADLSAVLLGADGLVRDDDDLVFYNAVRTTGVCWQANGDRSQTISIELTALAREIEIVRTLVSVDDDQPALDAGARLTATSDGSTSASFELAPKDGERCLIGVEFYRRANVWKVRAVGQGWVGGLAAALRAHGIAVEEAAAEPSAPVPGSAQTPPAASSAPPGAAATSPPATVAGPDDDSIAGALRAIRSLRHDLSQARRAHHTATAYAADKLLAAQENSRFSDDPGQLQRVQAECAALVHDADLRFEQECSGLENELVAEEFAMPLALARLDSLDWEGLASRPAQASGPRPIDRNDDSGTVVRLGSLYPPERASAKIPLAHPWAGRTLIWSDGPDRPASGPAWAHGLLARMLALTPAGAFDAQVVDLDGSLMSNWGSLGGSSAEDVTRRSTPAALTELVDALTHQCDLAAMAVESGIPGALDDVRDGARHLVVFGHYPHGYDDAVQRKIALCSRWAFALDVQIVVLAEDDAVAQEHPAGSAWHDLLQGSLWLQDRREPNIMDDTGVDWCFDPEVGASARSVAGRITTAGRRAG